MADAACVSPLLDEGSMIMIRLLSIASLCAFLAAPVLAEGDVKSGKKLFKKCKACHTVKEGKNKAGPSLYKIVDAPIGANADFKYSKALTGTDQVWDVETLTAFLTKPKEAFPGNKMSFPGLKKQSDIDDLIAYLIDESQ